MPLGGQGNLTIRGRGQGWGQTLGNGDSKLKNGDLGSGRGLVKFNAVPVRPRLFVIVPNLK